ncbi:hypothetical protein FLGE108171_08895 [Flavobacterium gelidilacus]|uniref:hypothetical protein n=1 Tax=Flavobacterium gelidilacus TaxID=206041 RepID=UPI0003FDD80E|nr:hypothetical protein [Flavobacterium gelidilacus]
MKNNLILFLIFISSVSLHAQTDNTEITVETVSRKWEFFDLINPKFSKEEYEETKEMLELTTIEFKEDMTFKFSFMVDLEGTWTLNKNVITTTDRRGKTTWTIYKISPKEITMSRNDAEQKIVFKVAK